MFTIDTLYVFVSDLSNCVYDAVTKNDKLCYVGVLYASILYAYCLLVNEIYIVSLCMYFNLVLMILLMPFYSESEWWSTLSPFYTTTFSLTHFMCQMVCQCKQLKYFLCSFEIHLMIFDSFHRLHTCWSVLNKNIYAHKLCAYIAQHDHA